MKLAVEPCAAANGSACHDSCYFWLEPVSSVRGVVLRSLPSSSPHLAATAPRSAAAELGVVRRSMRLLRITFTAAFCAMSGCSPAQTEKATETISLPSGEVLTNEFFLSLGRDSVRHNKLFFQQTASSPRELLGESIEEDAAPLSLHATKPFIQRSQDRTALMIGSHVFQRWLRKDGPYWYHLTTNPDPAASVFLRVFLPPGDFRISRSSPIGIRGWFDVPKPEVPYRFDHMDLDQNVLVTRRNSSDAAFPEFLVYGARQYGFTLNFDIERTRFANHIQPPPDAGILIDLSVVTYPGDLKLGKSREAALALPGATEIHKQTQPLSSNTWTTAECSFTIPTGTVINERFDALLGFRDPLPDYLSVFWRRHPILWDDWHFIRAGDWIRAEASGFKGGTCRIVFFRVRLPEPK